MKDAELLAHATRFTFPARPTPVEATHELTVEWRGAHMGRGSDDRWAVCWLGRCLNIDGEWEWEPQPSSREDDFLARCRFSRDSALAWAAHVVRHAHPAAAEPFNVRQYASPETAP